MGNLGKYFVDYYEEERGETVLIDERGWASYKHFPENKEIMICEMYVPPEHRRTGQAQRMAKMVEDVGKEKGCTHMSCWVHRTDNTEKERARASHKLRIFFEWGFIIASQNETQTVLIKDL